MLHWSLAESSGRFWQPSEFENVSDPDFKHINHLKNPGHLFLTKPSKYEILIGRYIWSELNIDLCFSNNIIRGNGGAQKGRADLMKYISKNSFNAPSNCINK